MRSLARSCFTHRRAVLAAWLVGLVVIAALHGAAGSAYKDSFRLSGTESADVVNLLQRVAPKQAGDSDRIVIASANRPVTDPAVRSRVQAMLTQVAALPHVAGVISPYAVADQVSRNGRIAFATVNFDQQAINLPLAAINKVVSVARSAAGSGLQVELGGQAIERTVQAGPGGIGIGFVAALIVLLLAFGSVLAALTPILVAGLSLGVGVSFIGLLSHVITMASFSSQLALLIGLGVGVDYALFIVTRFRQALQRGLTPEQAAVESLDTSGRAVMFAGITVCIALLGMFALGVSFLYGVAIAASVVVAFTVLAALTLLPALLGFLGLRALNRRERRALAAGSLTVNDESPSWRRWAGVLERRPALMAAAATLLMLVIASPVLSLRLGASDQGNDPTSATTRKAYDLLATGFGPGFNGPLQLVSVVRTPAQAAAVRTALTAAAGDRDVARVAPPRIVRGVDGSPPVVLANVVPRGSPQDKSTTDLLHRLRGSILPAAAGASGARILVGGQTAIFEDFSHVLTRKLPLFIGVVVLLSFLLLMAVFRSLVSPAMASVMNLLSVGAAFGVVVQIFQRGWLDSIIGISRTGPIEAFLPVIVFAILFGLSMDYEVFLVSRIYEEWHRRGDNREAIVHGLAATARTITAAATIMVLVFAAFILGGDRVIKLFGVGLASAVLLDALIVRSVLVPALMLKIGPANWALPRVLERRLPRLNVEGARATEAPEAI